MQAWIAPFIGVGFVAALMYLFRVFNGPDGERYLRQDTQGPFVPTGDGSDKAKKPPDDSDL